MKIAIPVDDRKVSERTRIRHSIHNAGNLVIYDVDTDFFDVIPVNGKGINDAAVFDLLQSNEIEAVISPEVSVMALKVFSYYDIAVYKAVEESTIKENIQKIIGNELNRFTLNDLFSGSSCSSMACGTCSSTCKQP